MPPITSPCGIFHREVISAATVPPPKPAEVPPVTGQLDKASRRKSCPCIFDPRINNREIQSLERATEATQCRVDYLWNAYNEGSIESFINEKTLFVIWQINVSRKQFPYEWLDQIVKNGLVFTEFPKLAVEVYLKHVSSIDTTTDDETYRWVENFFGTLIGFSELFDEFQNAVAEAGAIEHLVGYLSKSGEIMADAKANKHKENVLCYTLILLFNLARGFRMRPNFETCGAAKVLEAYFDYKESSYIRVIAAMCGARIDAGWPEACQLDNVGILQLLFDIFETAVLNENRRYRGISICEIGECLRLLAITDKDKELLIQKGILHFVGTLLCSTFQVEQAQGIDTLYAICSGKSDDVKPCLSVIDNNENCIQPLQWLAESSYFDDIKKQAKNFLDFLHTRVSKLTGKEYPKMTKTGSSNSLKGLSSVQQPKQKPTIFLSFHKNDAAAVKRIERLLIGNGFRIVNSAFSAENVTAEKGLPLADTVAVCFSEAYYLSQTCRREAEWVASLQKKIVTVRVDLEHEPEGWFKQLITSKSLMTIDGDESLSQTKVLQDLANILGE